MQNISDTVKSSTTFRKNQTALLQNEYLVSEFTKIFNEVKSLHIYLCNDEQTVNQKVIFSSL